MTGPYVNDEGDIWIERGIAPWPVVRREARHYATELLAPYPEGVLIYEGIEESVRVSDENEADWVHGDDDGCADAQDSDADQVGFIPCCRTIAAYHFRVVEP